MTFTRVLAAQALTGGAATLFGLTGGDLMIASLGAAACGFALFLLPAVMSPAAGQR